MARFRKKPVEVEAMQWDGTNIDALWDWGKDVLFAAGRDSAPAVFAFPPNGPLEAWVEKSQTYCQVEVGDWLIKESDGIGVYPCKGAVFAATYDRVPASKSKDPYPGDGYCSPGYDAMG